MHIRHGNYFLLSFSRQDFARETKRIVFVTLQWCKGSNIQKRIKCTSQPKHFRILETQYIWVKISSAVPGEYQDRFRSLVKVYRLYTHYSALILLDQHLLCGADKRLHRHLSHAFLAKYYNVYVVYINIATRYNAWLSQDWSSHTNALLASASNRCKYIKKDECIYE